MSSTAARMPAVPTADSSGAFRLVIVGTVAAAALGMLMLGQPRDTSVSPTGHTLPSVAALPMSSMATMGSTVPDARDVFLLWEPAAEDAAPTF
jgi:hypothetical protein